MTVGTLIYKATEYYLTSAPHTSYSTKSNSVESDYRFTWANETRAVWTSISQSSVALNLALQTPLHSICWLQPTPRIKLAQQKHERHVLLILTAEYSTSW